MSKPVNKTVIGLFVVVAIALLVAAILILGQENSSTHNPTFVMYFQGSVKGLSVGSPVVFRGVKVDYGDRHQDALQSERPFRYDPRLRGARRGFPEYGEGQSKYGGLRHESSQGFARL